MATVVNSVLDGEIDRYVRRYRRGLVNSLLQYLILNYLEKGKLCGYDIITLLHERFRTLLSPGQVYPVIDHMTDQGLLVKEKHGRSVLLQTSPLGESLLKAWREEFRAIQMQLSNPVREELRAVALELRQHFVVQRHLITANRTPVRGIKSQDHGPASIVCK